MQQQRNQPKRFRGMDRLPPLVVAVLLAGCPGDAASPAPAPSRTASVAATPAPEVSLREFCDVLPAEPSAFAFPELEAPGETATDGWGWVNVWATWCSPCIEEMPRIAAWEDRLRKDVGTGDVVFLSADALAADVTSFRTKRPEAPPSVRIASFDQLEPWLTSIGLDAAAVLPIHIFLDATDSIQCIRMGPVHDEDYELVRRLMTPG
jgi:thiol-disulfide isomerase/thioredoxin